MRVQATKARRPWLDSLARNGESDIADLKQFALLNLNLICINLYGSVKLRMGF
jgi:hypothetical protein